MTLDLDTLDLPDGTHATVLTGRDITSGEQLAYPVVWADRAYNCCPSCGRPILPAACPVILDTETGWGGDVQELSQQHGCGEWLTVAWEELATDATDQDVLDVANRLAADLATQIDQDRARLHASLLEDLADALNRLAEPLTTGETDADRGPRSNREISGEYGLTSSDQASVAGSGSARSHTSMGLVLSPMR